MTRRRPSLLDNIRTPPQPITPVLMWPGDSVQFAETKQWWRVRAVSSRYVILTAPYTLPNYPCKGEYHDRQPPEHQHVFYCIVDWERGVRGPDDHYGVGYETEDDIADAMRRLHHSYYQDGYEVPTIEVSHRAHSIRVRVARVIARSKK